MFIKHRLSRYSVSNSLHVHRAISLWKNKDRVVQGHSRNEQKPYICLSYGHVFRSDTWEYPWHSNWRMWNQRACLYLSDKPHPRHSLDTMVPTLISLWALISSFTPSFTPWVPSLTFKILQGERDSSLKEPASSPLPGMQHMPLTRRMRQTLLWQRLSPMTELCQTTFKKMFFLNHSTIWSNEKTAIKVHSTFLFWRHAKPVLE